jgi:hypothetical protein
VVGNGFLKGKQSTPEFKGISHIDLTVADGEAAAA